MAKRWRRRMGCVVAMAIAIGLSDGLAAQDAVGLAMPARVGEQRWLSDLSDEAPFAGRTLLLQGFTGMLGLSSEMAYVVVVAGSASDGNIRAMPGQMLLIPPYGAAPSRQRFDARRLLAGMDEAQRAAAPGAVAALTAIARRQRRGMFLGRFTRTSFDAAAPGSAQQELAARSVKGSAPVSAIRFASQSAPTAVEQGVVDAFLRALAAGDTDAAAALMDPTPYGGGDLRGGGGDARLSVARHLVASRPWQTLLADARPRRDGDGNGWTVEGPGVRGVLTLRPIGDFVFVRSIDLEGQ